MGKTARNIGVIVLLAMVCPAIWGQERRVPLLDVGRGHLPNDTSQEDRSRIRIVADHVELGGPALEVGFAPGDSFGMSRSGFPSDWTPFAAVEFPIFNPEQGDVELVFTVRHRATTGFASRVDIPITVRPGKRTVRLAIPEMVNVNGSRPDLSEVRHWYLAAPGDGAPTLYFGIFMLVGGKTNAPPAPKTLLRSDPERTARIRAATMPEITGPVEFDTPEADAILAALEVFPPDNHFNLVIEDWPVHPNSERIVASIGAEKPFRYNPDMAFIIVPPDQPRVPLRLVEYPDESDPGPYPIPDHTPIEGWPVSYQRSGQRGLTLKEIQKRPGKYEGDRHAIIVDPVRRRLYEFFTFGRTADGWGAGQASIFDLSSNALRPDGWTSADAAGLPIFPAVVRYDELQRGAVEHALRVTVTRTRRAYVHPATHFASSLTDENLPRMGERLRLRRDFDVTGFTPPVQTILTGLKKYGMFVADNGIDWAISVTPDPRIPELHGELRKVKGADFEVVVCPE